MLPSFIMSSSARRHGRLQYWIVFAQTDADGDLVERRDAELELAGLQVAVIHGGLVLHRKCLDLAELKLLQRR